MRWPVRADGIAQGDDMFARLRVLIVEDKDEDAELALHALRQAGIEVDWLRVATEQDYLARLDNNTDVILACYALSQFGALQALKLLQQRGLDIPLIVVTESISEEAAVECLKQGAADYVLKDGLARLGEAVRHAIREKELRQAKQHAQNRTRHLNSVLRAVRGVNQLIVRAKDDARLLQSGCEALVSTGGYDAACLALVDEDGSVAAAASAGLSEECKALSGQVENGQLPECMRRTLSGPTMLAINELGESCRGCPLITICRWRARASLRLEHGHRVYGLVSVSLPIGLAADQEERDILVEVASDFAFALHAIEEEKGRQRAARQSKEDARKLLKGLRGTANAMAAIVELKDRYAAGHQRRVSEIACKIGGAMGLSADRIEGIRTAASIHDLGKIQIPAEILAKPERLTEAELDIVKAHPTVGYEMLKTIEFPWPVARTTLQHHERMNGSGYPSGISGDDILMDARILAVADVIEAMCSDRPHRPALGIGQALEEISANRGVLYDPWVGDACVSLFADGGSSLEGLRSQTIAP